MGELVAVAGWLEERGVESESAWIGSIAPKRGFVGLEPSAGRAPRRSNAEQGLRFPPDQHRYHGDRCQHDQHRDVEA